MDSVHTKGRGIAVVAAIIASAALARLPYLQQANLSPDAADYINIGRNLACGRGLVPHRQMAFLHNRSRDSFGDWRAAASLSAAFGAILPKRLPGGSHLSVCHLVHDRRCTLFGGNMGAAYGPELASCGDWHGPARLQSWSFDVLCLSMDRTALFDVAVWCTARCGTQSRCALGGTRGGASDRAGLPDAPEHTGRCRGVESLVYLSARMAGAAQLSS